MTIKYQSFIVYFTIKMNSQLGNTRNCLLRCKQCCASVTKHNVASNAKIAIQPGVEKGPAVHLYLELVPVKSSCIGIRLDVQSRRVRVRANDTNSILSD